MNVQARRILDGICTAQSFTPAMLTPLQRLDDFSEELSLAIEQASTERRWGCVCRLVWVAQRFPNQSLVPVLIRLLDAREDDTYLEAIVDALAMIPADGADYRKWDCPVSFVKSTNSKMSHNCTVAHENHVGTDFVSSHHGKS